MAIEAKYIYELPIKENSVNDAVMKPDQQMLKEDINGYITIII